MFPDTPHISTIKGLLDEGHMAHKVLFHGPSACTAAPLRFWSWLRFRLSAFPLASGTVPLNDNQATPNPCDNQVPLTRSPLIKARSSGGDGGGSDGAIFDSADWRGEAASEALQSQRSAEAATNFSVTTGISLY